MNRALFITIGIVLILFVFLLWIFLFLYGAPDNTREVFSDLGIVEPQERIVEPIPEGGIDENSVVLNLTDGQLQQITTVAIAGFGTASTTEGKQILRYVERGTGHIYEVNLGSGLKKQLVPETTPGTSEAYFSPDLNSVVLVSNQTARLVNLFLLPQNEVVPLETLKLVADAENIEFLDDQTVAYTRNNYQETIGYTLDLTERTVASRFTSNLPDAMVHTSSLGEIYTYPKPTKHLAGAAYTITNNQLIAATDFLTGFVPVVGDQLQAINFTDNDWYNTVLWPSNAFVPIIMLPEKCVTNDSNTIVWCGAPSSDVSADYLEDWYKGIITSNDWLWEIDTTAGVDVVEPKSLINPTEATGRIVDVINMQTGPTEDTLFFQNKTDGSLWLFKI